MKKKVPPELRFHDRLLTLRKERGLTQQALAEMVEMHISQIRRYEGGQSQPTLDAIRKLAVGALAPSPAARCSSFSVVSVGIADQLHFDGQGNQLHLAFGGQDRRSAEYPQRKAGAVAKDIPCGLASG